MYFWDIQRRWFNLKNEILMGKNKKAAYSKREEEKANRIVKGLFIGLIVLALVIMVAMPCMDKNRRRRNSEVLLRLFFAGLFLYIKTLWDKK